MTELLREALCHKFHKCVICSLGLAGKRQQQHPLPLSSKRGSAQCNEHGQSSIDPSVMIPPPASYAGMLRTKQLPPYQPYQDLPSMRPSSLMARCQIVRPVPSSICYRQPAKSADLSLSHVTMQTPCPQILAHRLAFPNIFASPS